MEWKFFDLDRAVSEAGLSHDVINAIVAEAAADFPDRGNLYELHVIRAIQAEQASRMTPEAWLEDMKQQSATMLSELHLEQAPVHDVRQQLRKKTP